MVIPTASSYGVEATPRRTEGRSLRARQDPHSFFLIFAAILFVLTLIVDLVLHRADLDLGVLIALVVASVALGVAALLLGERFPRWLGLVCVGIFAVATLYFLSPLGDEQSAVSSMQELPILSLYLGWFVRQPLSRLIMLGSLVLVALAMIANPIFWVDGSLGVTTAVQAVVAAVFCYEVGSALWRRTEREILTDVLTGAFNRAGFMSKLRTELARAQKSGVPLTLVVIDFDRFKQLNDTQGHAAGDEALVETVKHWQLGVRPKDIVGRTGGDEFAILLDRTDAHGAQQTMLRLRASSKHAWSWGISQARGTDDVETLFDRADNMLYAAKRKRA